MKSAEEFTKDFIQTLENMKKYQGIDITNPSSYGYNRDVIHKAFALEKNIVYTQEEKGKELVKIPDKKTFRRVLC